MRAYLPVGWEGLRALAASGSLAGPVRACVVDPAWRAGAPDIDEEQWEHEAQLLAADAVPSGGGVVLAADVAEPAERPEDGWVVLRGPIRRADLAAVLTAELAWFGVQEIPVLLAGGGPPGPAQAP